MKLNIGDEIIKHEAKSDEVTARRRQPMITSNEEDDIPSKVLHCSKRRMSSHRNKKMVKSYYFHIA